MRCCRKTWRCVALEEAAEGFHATYDALGKTYRYQIHNGRVPADLRPAVYVALSSAARCRAMHAAAQALVGKHDFSSFESIGSERPTRVRTITALLSAEALANRSTGVTIEVSGDGFLYNMVRAIVGTLVEVGEGLAHIGWPAEVLAACDRTRAGQTAPPQGFVSRARGILTTCSARCLFLRAELHAKLVDRTDAAAAVGGEGGAVGRRRF